MPLGCRRSCALLQEREVGDSGRAHRLRSMCAMLITTSRLQIEVHAARFREDLYYRLNVFPLLAPLLRAAR